MPKAMPPIKKSVADQNPEIEKTQIPNEEQAKLEAGRKPESMKEAAMCACGMNLPARPAPRPKSMREAVGKAAKRKGKKKG